MTCATTPRDVRAQTSTALIDVQDAVREHFQWTHAADVKSAAMLRDACNNHPQADRLGWSSQQRKQTLNRIERRLLEATQIVLVGAAIDAASLERPWTDGTVFVAADGAVGACFERVEVACVVSDLDGEPYLSQAVEKGIPVVVHAHGDNPTAWAQCLEKWSRLETASIVLTHQSKENHEDIHNVGGFTDGDRAACFLSWVGVPPEKVRYLGFATDRVGPWSGTTDPPRKLEKLVWMDAVLDLLDVDWRERKVD